MLRTGIRLLAGAAAVSFACTAFAQAQPTLEQDAKAFGAREAVQAPDLSADGSNITYITPAAGRTSVAVVGNLTTGKFTQMAASNGNENTLRSCNFVSATRAVCEITGLNAKAAAGDIIGYQRLISINTDGSDPKQLGQSQSAYDAYMRQFDASVVDWLQGTDNKVLLEREYVPEEYKLNTRLVRNKSGLGVDLVDASSLRASPLEEPRDGTASYMSDGQGHVRLMTVAATSSSGVLTGQISYLYRKASSRDWLPLVTVGDANNPDFQPLAIDASIDSLYALKKLNGRNALYRIKLDGSMAEQLVAENARVDIDDVVRFGDGQKVIGYTFTKDASERIYFDPEFQALAQSVSKALPKSPIIEFVDASRDGSKLLIFAGSDSDPGRYYLFDRNSKTLTLAMIGRPELEGRPLATVRSVEIPGSGGVSIPAYLTIPPGKDSKNLPAVVLPHGGPSARDVWGFDWLPQFLAARGYVVLQPQYRGSAGFGDAWLNENGFKNWRTSIGDITDATKWLAAQGIADPNRTAILGWSYGGYAALQSAATEPSLYKAVVAIAPVTDLATLKQDYANFTIRELVEREIGSGPHLAEGSPLRHVAEIRAPVLLVHGTLDNNVRFAHSQRMDAALRAAGKQSELLKFDGLDHQLDDSDARVQMLTRIGELLDRTIGH
ncbi:MAG: alpha/beta hydrolase family protein [Sphingomicrobium sp.]